MFISKYIPININRTTEAVFTSKGLFPARLLDAAMDALNCGENGVAWSIENEVYFYEYPEIMWNVADALPVYNMLEAARKANFSYYTVCDEFDNIQLLVSKLIGNIRLVTFSTSMETFIVSAPPLVKLVGSLIDKQCSLEVVFKLRSILCTFESMTEKFLNALLVDRNNADEGYMALNPVLCPNALDLHIYGFDLLDELESILNGSKETDGFYAEADGTIVRKNSSNFKFTHSYAQNLVHTYHELLKTKSNYAVLYDEENSCPCLYVSTNYRYLVNAQTFNTVILKNEHLKATIDCLLETSNTYNRQLLNSIWEAANAEAEHK